MSNLALAPTGMDNSSQLQLKAQIAARTTRKTEWNTRYGVGMALSENQVKMIQKKNEAWQNSYSRLLVMQSATVGAAEAELLDFRKEVKESKYYRQATKKAVNGINYEFLEKWSYNFLKREYKNNNTIMLDIMDKSVATLKPDVTKLYWCIKQEMDNEHVPDSAIKARAYMCALLVSFACDCHDAHIAIGPFILDVGRTNTKEVQMRELLNQLRDGKTLEQIKTEGYDYDYACTMKDARPTLLKMQTATIKQGVCGTWTHTKGGMVDGCINAIRNRVTDYAWLDKMSLGGLMDNGMFDEEIALLKQFDVFANGEVDMTIDLLEAVKWYRLGKTDQEIVNALAAAYDYEEIGRPRVERVMGVINLLRLCAEHEDGAEYFNALDKVWREHGKEAAAEFHRKSQEMSKKKKEQSVADEFVIAGHEDEADAPEKEDTYTEEDVMRAMLASKFGKVSKAKEKKKVAASAKPKKTKAESTPAVEALPKGAEHKTETEAEHKEADVKTEHVEAQPLKLEIQPPTKKRTNNHWSEDEEAYLMQEVEKNVPFKTIGMMLHRTEAACYQRTLLIRKRVKVVEPELGI